jgi:hypothetical protein
MVAPVGIGLSEFEKAEALADSLETVHSMNGPSIPKVIGMFELELRTYSMTPASETI